MESEFYDLKITRKQAEVLSMACEFLSRIQCGQIREVFEHLPLQTEIEYETLHEIQDQISLMMPVILKRGIDGWSRSFSIGSDEVHKSAGIAYDLHQVIRHKLSWEKAVKRGVIKSEDSPRKFPEMITVDFDDPRKVSAEPLAQITRSVAPSSPSEAPSLLSPSLPSSQHPNPDASLVFPSPIEES